MLSLSKTSCWDGESSVKCLKYFKWFFFKLLIAWNPYKKINSAHTKTLNFDGDFFLELLVEPFGDSDFSISAKQLNPNLPTGLELSRGESSNSISPLSSAIFKW